MSDDVETIDQFIQGVEAALTRAQARAVKIARETGTSLIMQKDGRVIEVHPDDFDTVFPVEDVSNKRAG